MTNILFLIKSGVVMFICSVVAGEFLMDARTMTLNDHVITREHSVGNNTVRINPKFLSSTKEKEIMKKPSLLLVRKLMNQGGILSKKQNGIIDNMVAKNNLTCDGCAVGVRLLQLTSDNGVGEAIISLVAIEVCRAVRIEDDRVCHLAVDEFRDMIFYILFHLKPNEMCFWLLESKCPKPEGFLENWFVHLSPGPKPPHQAPKQPPAGKPTTNFLFFTDMHMDVQYQPGASAVCGEPLCCRNNDQPPHDAADEAWKFGDFRNCDPPSWTAEGMMESLKGKPVDFIFYTGDIPAHDVWNQTRADQVDKIQRWTEILKKYFPNTPVYAAVGNHESAPVNSYPPSSIYDQPGANITWLYEALHESWRNWVPEEDLSTVMRGGFFTTLIRKSVRVVSLNTNYCSDDSWWLLVGENAVDPQGQLQWFAEVMHQAEVAKEKVFIISHRPTHGCMAAWSYNYYTIVNRYEDTIIAQLFGHAHTDELNLYYDVNDESRVSLSALIGPAFTTYSYLNSGYRIYKMDGDYEGTTDALLDAESYFLNITEANRTGNQKWELEYTFSKDYGMKNLAPAEWQQLIERFESDDKLFQLYHRHITKSADTSVCDANCKSSTIAGIKKHRVQL